MCHSIERKETCYKSAEKKRERKGKGDTCGFCIVRLEDCLQNGYMLLTRDLLVLFSRIEILQPVIPIRVRRPFHANFTFKLQQSMERKTKTSVIQNLNIWVIISLIITYGRVIFHTFDFANSLNKLFDA